MEKSPEAEEPMLSTSNSSSLRFRYYRNAAFPRCQKQYDTARVNPALPSNHSGGQPPMPNRHARWLTAQETAAMLHTTSADVCRLLKLGRLTGAKRKQPGRAGKAQWLVNPISIDREKRRIAKV